MLLLKLYLNHFISICAEILLTEKILFSRTQVYFFSNYDSRKGKRVLRKSFTKGKIEEIVQFFTLFFSLDHLN